MCSVQQMYYDRNKYISNSEYPHFYIDRHHIWQPRYTDVKVPSEPDYIVIEVCGDYSDTKTDFLLNELHAIIFGVGELKGYNIPLKRSSLKVSDDLWRTVMEHGNFDPLIDGKPSSKVLDKVQASLLELYQNRNKVLKEVKVVKRLKLISKLIRKKSHQILLLQVVQLNHQLLSLHQQQLKFLVNLKLLSFIVITHLIKQLIFK